MAGEQYSLEELRAALNSPIAEHRIGALYHIAVRRNPILWTMVLPHLADPATRPHAVNALAETGSAEAIPHLRLYLADHSDGMPDDRGCMLSNATLADQAIRRLEYLEQHPDQRPAPWEPAPGHQDDQRSQLPPGTIVADRPEPVGGYSPPVVPISQWWPVQMLAYAPLLLVGAEIVWLGVVIIGFLYTGKLRNDPASTRLFDGIAMLPALAGVAIGIGVMALNHPRGPAARFCLWLGTALCVGIVAVFGREMLTAGR